MDGASKSTQKGKGKYYSYCPKGICTLNVYHKTCCTISYVAFIPDTDSADSHDDDSIIAYPSHPDHQQYEPSHAHVEKMVYS